MRAKLDCMRSSEQRATRVIHNLAVECSNAMKEQSKEHSGSDGDRVILSLPMNYRRAVTPVDLISWNFTHELNDTLYVCEGSEIKGLV
jgi:hypothetical protein